MSVGIVIGDSHITEFNGRAGTLEAIVEFVRSEDFKSRHSKVDFFASTGDLIADPSQRSKEGEPLTLTERLHQTITKSNFEIERSIKIIYDIQNAYDNDQERLSNEITDKDKEELENAHKDLQRVQSQTIAPFLNAHKAVAKGLSALADEAEVYLVKGNWDTKFLDGVANEVSQKSKKEVHVLENMTSSPTRTSSGKMVEFQGSTNTWEVPPIYSLMYQSPVIKEVANQIFIDYGLGHNIKEDSEKQEISAHEKELERLRSGKTPDYFITHTIGAPDSQNDIGEVNGDKGYSTTTYLFEDKKDEEVVVLTGHKHSSRFYWRQGKLILRFGPDQFGVVERDDESNRVKNIEVYEYVLEKDEKITHEEAMSLYGIGV